MSPRDFFAGMFMSLGGLIVAIAGPCTLIGVISALAAGNVDKAGVPLMFGGIPFLIGLGMKKMGRGMGAIEAESVLTAPMKGRSIFIGVGVSIAILSLCLGWRELSRPKGYEHSTDLLIAAGFGLLIAVCFCLAGWLLLRGEKMMQDRDDDERK